MKNNDKLISRLVDKVLNETIQGRAEKIESQLKRKEVRETNIKGIINSMKGEVNELGDYGDVDDEDYIDEGYEDDGDDDESQNDSSQVTKLAERVWSLEATVSDISFMVKQMFDAIINTTPKKRQLSSSSR